MDADTLRLYASIFMKPRRHGGQLYPPTEACIAASRALATLAEIVEAEPAIARYYGGLTRRAPGEAC
jgi:hypothetical protein